MTQGVDQKNVFGEPLLICGTNPLTGIYRDGCCNTNDEDVGKHVICARMTLEFLEFSYEKGNDLITPRPEAGFPGLSEGDHWCLCALRWLEAFDAGIAPPVFLGATNMEVLELVDFADLKQHALDLN